MKMYRMKKDVRFNGMTYQKNDIILIQDDDSLIVIPLNGKYYYDMMYTNSSLLTVRNNSTEVKCY